MIILWLYKASLAMRRTPVLVATTIATMAAALFLLGLLALFGQRIIFWASTLAVDTPLSLVLADPLDPQRQQMLMQQLNSWPEVAQLKLLTPKDIKAQASVYGAKFEQLLQDTPEAVMPTLIEVTLTPNAKRHIELQSQFLARARKLPELVDVDWFADGLKQLHQIVQALHIATQVAWMIVLGCVGLIIFNTMTLSIYNYREDIVLLRLIGATRLFIVGPFVMEGIVLGCLSAGVAHLALIILTAYGGLFELGNFNQPYRYFFGIYEIAVLMGGVGSMAASWRFLSSERV